MLFKLNMWWKKLRATEVHNEVELRSAMRHAKRIYVKNSFSITDDIYFPPNVEFIFDDCSIMVDPGKTLTIDSPDSLKTA